MRSYRAQHNLFAVSANARETAINTEQALDTTMLIGLSDVPNREPRRESNADELTGKEEPDAIYDLGGTAAMPVNFPKAQAQHFAWLLAYALGTTTSAAAGDGYKHTITPIEGDLDADRSLPSMTGAFRYGDSILLKPPVKPATWALWAAPALFLGVGLLLALRLFRQARPRAGDAGEDRA